MAKYLTRRMKRKITRATITEYSISAVTERTVKGKVKIIIRIRNNDKKPLINILLKYFRSKFSPF
ncbi:hypothetical protein [Ignavibacterium album]|jgi:hypothetical protein|uniref:hypothetical protein n=1 Tax=Ignavibacterium album TaxID=591197 RepID=UPI0026ED36A0|nr:hypothetical protein [Ignavibacterium album]